MHLQSLELLGFKSFADKTIFNFHEGITAIVGPNGCGKSNVLDAVRWVLGEQSAKSLRGDEMADVIFNGTDARKPVGFAEVSVSFTDCAKELAVDWHDVRVTRRVYRDGNSEYLLNKIPCRLRDIQSLFADTGIARTAYSIPIIRANSSIRVKLSLPIVTRRLRGLATRKRRAALRSTAAKISSPSSVARWTTLMHRLPMAAANYNVCKAKSARIKIETNSIGNAPKNWRS